MTLFAELYEMATAGPVVMQVVAYPTTRKLTVNVIPKPDKDFSEAALRTPLTLTATPEDFDANFIEVVRSFRHHVASLKEQAETTMAVLDAAKAASSKKAQSAVSKSAKAALVQPTAVEEKTGGGDTTGNSGNSIPTENDDQPNLFG